MNSYSLTLFSPWYLFVALLMLTIGITYFTYRETVPPVSGSKKILLILLRSFAYFLFILVIMEPVLTRISGSFNKPKTVVLLDNSLSMSLSDGQGSRKTPYKMVLDKIVAGLDEEHTDYISIGADVKKLLNPSFDSLKLNEQTTDLSKGIKFVNSDKEQGNTGAVIIISDGVYNSGLNPIYEAEQTGKKYYIIGIGDSNDQKDISVQSLLLNEIAYLEEIIPVNVNIKASGFKDSEIKVRLKENGNLIGEQTIRINPSQMYYSLVFEFIPKTEGIRKITAEASFLSGEITEKNNTNSEFINVLKNKKKIVIFAGSPNPDITYFKNAIGTEKGLEIKSFIQKQGAAFFEGTPTKSSVQEAELIVLIGFPINSSPQSVIQMIAEEAQKGKPILFIASQFMDYSKLKTLEDYLPFNTLSSKPMEFLATANFPELSEGSPFLKIQGVSSVLDLWNQLPPVFKTETFVKAKPESEILASMKVNNTSLKEPMILSRNFQNKKSLAVLGYGLYRWKMLGYAQEVAKGRTETKDLYSAFIKNAHRWLSLNQQNKNIIIKTTKKNYLRGEAVEFFAQIYDEQYAPVDDANVKVQISMGSGETKDIFLSRNGNGKYTGILTGMKPAEYYFSGEAELNGKKLGKDRGNFSVGDISLEYLDLKMNKGLLQTIATRTGGKFFTPDQIDDLISQLKNNPDLKEKGITEKKEYALWNLAWILGIGIFFLGLEWLIRKRSGMM